VENPVEKQRKSSDEVGKAIQYIRFSIGLERRSQPNENVNKSAQGSTEQL
jgi:hypothetical protein